MMNTRDRFYVAMSGMWLVLLSLSMEMAMAIPLTQKAAYSPIRFSSHTLFSSVMESPLSPSSFSDKESYRSHDKGRHDARDLTVFIVDMSLPGGKRRIEAVKGAVRETLPKGRVAVITCSEDSAEVCVKPTGSLLLAQRSMSHMKKSVMGNLGAGLSKALDVLDAEILLGTSKITVAIIADGKAHGLVSGSLDCIELDSVCNVELLTSAVAIADAKIRANMAQQNIRVVVVDTEESDTPFDQKISSVRSGLQEETGLQLATITDADYFHFPDLSHRTLMRLLNSST